MSGLEYFPLLKNAPCRAPEWTYDDVFLVFHKPDTLLCGRFFPGVL